MDNIECVGGEAGTSMRRQVLCALQGQGPSSPNRYNGHFKLELGRTAQLVLVPGSESRIRQK